jgi:glycosyltransferase involved in cell wall biosynthesis
MVARYDPYKDHTNLLLSLSILRKRQINFKCLLVGTQICNENTELMNLISALDIEKNVILIGQRNDVPVIMRSLDFHVLSSSSEGFPNVVAEAMAVGTPCVVTDVGDAAHIVADTGWVVPPGNPAALADAIECAFLESKRIEWNIRCVAARERIKQHFSIEQMTVNYQNIWREVVSKCVR